MNKKNSINVVLSVVRPAALIMGIAAAAGCSPITPYMMTPVPVTVTFGGANDLCPISVSPATVSVKRNQKIEWQSTPGAKNYSIHYEPFHGKQIKSVPSTGVALSPPIDGKAPEIEYKYTVIGEGCPTPLDPRIIVHK